MKSVHSSYKPWRVLGETTGNIAVAAFLICLLSGVILAIPYDIREPYASITAFLIYNPYASFIRNLHYWSAQGFLLFTLLHLADYIRQKAGGDIRRGLWARLLILLAMCFYAMLSGFILKGDAESLHARSVLESLLASLPLAGTMMASFFSGTADDLQLVYVNHIATAGILLSVVIFEHIRRIWASWPAIWKTLLAVSLLSILLIAPLHDGLDPLTKGPWYFIGLQEVLHWMPRPGWSWAIVVVCFACLWVLPLARPKLGRALRLLLLAGAIGYLLLSLIAFFFRGPAWEWQVPRPKVGWVRITPRR